MIGRKKEQDNLLQCLESKRPEFLVVYGRRRVGKTYLIKEYFNEKFSFYATGIPSEDMKSQLTAFKESLIEYQDQENNTPKNWFEAFRRLKTLLSNENVYRDPTSKKRVVFLDEVPWMDTARSDFKSAMDYFWNSWASSQKDLVLIVCGSATSWIINNIIGDNGGFYNRITRQMLIEPFSLNECKQYFIENEIKYSDTTIIESYMVFGGIPYYLNLMDKRLSLASNIDELIFNPRGNLHYEYDHLFSSLFKRPANYLKVIESISQKKGGLQRTELAVNSGVSDGEGLTKVLRELEECCFIRRYKNYSKNKNGFLYQVIDPFVLFALNFLKDDKLRSWQGFIKSPAYYAWRGNAFEIVCLNHIDQIKNALGISGVESTEFSWRSKKKKDGVQIDLLIDRRDDVINVCEMKYTNEPFEIDKKYADNLNHKVSVFIEETGTKKTVHLTLVTVNGMSKNEYSDVVQNVISSEQLLSFRNAT